MNRIFLITVLLCITVIVNAQDQINSDKPSIVVPDSETAKKIAVAIWLPIFGKKIYREKPFNTSLVGDSVWVVTGSIAKGKRGGVAYIEIKKNNCEILKIAHGK